MLGPVEHTSPIAGDITAIPGREGHAQVLWITPSDRQIASLELDSKGRPGPVTTYMPRNVQHFAAAADENHTVHIVWLTTSSPGTWTAHYSAGQNATPQFATSHAVFTFTLAPEESITTFALGLDQTSGYVIIGTSTAAQPDHEQVTSIAFDLHDPAQTRAWQIRLPTTIDKATVSAPTGTILTGPIAPLARPPQQTAPLRWPRPFKGVHDLFALALTIRLDDNWRPAVVYFEQGTPRGYQIVASSPADAAPPTGTIDAAGDLFMTWAGLEHTQPRRYSASTTGNGREASPTYDYGIAQALAGIARGLLFSTLWIIVPATILLLAPISTWTPALLLAAYSLTKIAWPPALFAQVPPLLATDPLEHISAAGRVGVTATLITLIALCAASYAHHTGRPAWKQWVVFVAVDLSLTLSIFGTNLAG